MRTRLNIKSYVHWLSCFVLCVRAHTRTHRGDRVLTVLKYETAAHALACNAIKLYSLHMEIFLHSPNFEQVTLRLQSKPLANKHQSNRTTVSANYYLAV
jgi:hypothetical protein